MSRITDLNTTKTRLHRLMEASTPKKKPTSNKLIPVLLILCILGTMIPFQLAMTFFSLSFATIVLLSLILMGTGQAIFNKKVSSSIAVLIATSAISGCSPAFTFQNPPELITIAYENNYKIHTIRRVGILGLGTSQATVETAQAESHIKKVRAIQIDKGHGLINIITITVAGEA